jgi:hypothetical protein
MGTIISLAHKVSTAQFEIDVTRDVYLICQNKETYKAFQKAIADWAVAVKEYNKHIRINFEDFDGL